MKKIVLLLVVLSARIVTAQSPLTVVSDVITRSDGTHPSGTVTISWTRGLDDSNPRKVIFPGSKTIQVVNGVINVSLFPNSVALPPGQCYGISYRLGLQNSTRYWFVPASGTPVTLNQIESSVPCTPTNNAIVAPAQITPGQAGLTRVLTSSPTGYVSWGPAGGAGMIDLNTDVTGQAQIVNGGTGGTTVTTALANLGLAGVPYDIRRSGAVCDGTDQNAAVQAALLLGYTTIYIPAGCKWIAPSGIMPSTLATPITYRCENLTTSIIQSASDPATLGLQGGPGAQFYGCDAKGNSTGVAPFTQTCPIGHYANYRDVNAPVLATCYTAEVLVLGQGSTDLSTTNIQNFGVGDAIFASTNNTNGVAVRADLESGGGSEFMCDINGGTGGSCFSILENSANNTSVPFAWFSTFRTAGNVVQFNQRTSTFTGNVFFANMADISGIFTGNFLDMYTAGISKFRTDYAGNMTFAGRDAPLPVNVPVVTGQNDNLAIGTHGTIGLITAGGDYSVTGFAGGAEGMRLTVIDSTGHIATFRNQHTGSDVGKRIFIPLGADYVCPHAFCIVDFVYYGGQWELKAPASNGGVFGVVGCSGTPDAPLTVSNATGCATPVAPDTGTLLHLISADGSSGIVEMDAYGTTAAFIMRAANGTIAAKTATTNGQNMLQLIAEGYDPTNGYSLDGVLGFAATQTHTSTAHGTKFSILTVPNGSTTLTTAMIVDQDQSITGAAYINAVSGYRYNGAATVKNVLRGNGTNFVDAQLQFSDLGGGAAPTPSACGTGPSLLAGSSIFGGTITEGSAASGCVLTFASAPLSCTVTSQAGLGFTYALSGAVLTITNVGALSSTKVDWKCTN